MNGTILGIVDKRIVYQNNSTKPNRNIFVVGGPGSYKTQSVVITNLFNETENSIVVTDPKGELYEKTAGIKLAQGYQVHVVNFANMAHSDRYNPFDYIQRDIQAETVATKIVQSENAEGRGYLVTEKNKLHVSEAGITLCKAVELEPLLTSPEMTAEWEQALQQISTEERTPDNFLSQIKKFIVKLIADVPTQLTGSAAIKQQIDHQQQAQKAAEVFLETPQAIVLNKQKFYIVKPKQGEDFTLPKKWSSKTLGKTAIKALVTKGETSKLKGFKSKKGKSFDAKLKLDGHKLSFDFD